MDAINKGHRTCLVRTVDTDVAVILLESFVIISQILFSCKLLDLERTLVLWILTSWVKKSPCINIYSQLHYHLPFRRDKKMDWEAWKKYPEVTAAFLAAALNPYPGLTSAFMEY